MPLYNISAIVFVHYIMAKVYRKEATTITQLQIAFAITNFLMPKVKCVELFTHIHQRFNILMVFAGKGQSNCQNLRSIINVLLSNIEIQ